jgi:hypothetical protein
MAKKAGMVKKTGTFHPTEDQLLTAEDIFSGGDDLVSPLRIPELSKNGKPGIVYLKLLSAGDVLDFSEADEGSRKERLLPLIAKAVVHQDGTPMFSQEQVARLSEIRVDVFNRLSRAVTDKFNTMMSEEEESAKGKGGTGTDDLPIV